MRDYLEKLIARKREEMKKLQERSDASSDLAEVRSIGETLKALATEIADAEAQLDAIDEPADGAGGEGRKMMLGGMDHKPEQRGERNATQEYRTAFLKRLMGKPLTDAEARDMASTNVVIPVQTQNEIITKIKEVCPLLDEVTLLNVAGSVTFAVEGTVGDAALHTENAPITSASDSLVSVTLAGYEIVKLVRISATVKTMSLDAFEGWLSEMLARKVGEEIEEYIINGTGSSQPKGIDSAATWTDETNAVAWAGTAPTAAEVMELISLLPSRHARSAKFLMNRKTFWTYIMPLRDDKKIPIVADEGAGAYNIFGYPVLLSDFALDGDIFFGNMKMIVANLADAIKVDSSEASGFAYNAIDYRGTAIFDCDIADGAAFVKSAKTL